MSEEEKKEEIVKKYQEKWSKSGLLSGLSENTQQLYNNQLAFGEGIISESGVTNESSDFSLISFPTVRRVAAATIANGGWYKSDKQKLRESRANKLKVLKGEEPNVVLPDDIFVDGLVSVQPMAGLPIGQLMFLDFKYESKNESKERKQKIKYILQKIIKKIWTILSFSKKK